MDISQYRKAFYKRTRKGKVIRILQEKYVRDDITYGSLYGEELTREKLIGLLNDAPHKQILIPDTNVILHQLDILEYDCPATGVVIVLQTVLQELRHLNLSIYKRVLLLFKDTKRTFIFFPNELTLKTACTRESTESANDYNDRLIRIATHYIYRAVECDQDDDTSDDSDSNIDMDMGTATSSSDCDLLQCKKAVVLLSNDKIQRTRCEEEYGEVGVLSLSDFIAQFVELYPELSDLHANMPPSADSNSNSGELDLNSPNIQNIYTPHCDAATLSLGLKGGGPHKLYKGILQCKRGDDYNDCYVIVHMNSETNSKSMGKEQDTIRRSISIKGYLNVNRAISGDSVAVRLLSDEREAPPVPKTEPKAQIVAGIAAETAEASPAAIEGLISNSSKELQGCVVGILRRSPRQYAGSIDNDSATQSELASAEASVLFRPVDKRIPPVRIATRRLADLLGQRLLISIDHWPANSEVPHGHYVRKLGADGDKSVETQVLLHEFGVPHEAFSDEVMACLPPTTWSIANDVMLNNNRYLSKGISDESISNSTSTVLRRDLRSLPVVSIDPPGCKDIDDALHCRVLSNGNYEVGVHIADVTYFVHPDSALDKEAAHRSTSTYLVERRLDMLPSLLTTELCSLRSKEDHLAFSVLWEMDGDANIVGEVQFCKSIIHSVASLTYDEAQIMLDAPPVVMECAAEPVDKYDKNNPNVVSSVKMLNVLAIKLRQKRIAQGALTLASPEVRFKLDSETQNPTDVAMYALKQANALVEEMMLLANITVSKKILRHYPTLAVLRRHQPPTKEQFAPLVSAARAVGVHIDISSSKKLADSLDAAQRPGDPYFNKLLRILSTRCMMPAQYFCSGEIPPEEWHHYGLAAPVYTHFTSPIRRYADVIVHRLLAAAIGVIPLPSSNSDRSRQQDQCSHMNRRHKAAQYAQRASVNLNTLLYFKLKPSQEDAYILSVLPDAITILVPRFGIEGTINFELKSNTSGAGGADMRGDHQTAYKYGIQTIEHIADSHTIELSLVHRNNGKLKPSNMSLQVFQQVRVNIVTLESSSGNRDLEIELLVDETAALTGVGAGAEETVKRNVSSVRGRDKDTDMQIRNGKGGKKQRRV